MSFLITKFFSLTKKKEVPKPSPERKGTKRLRDILSDSQRKKLKEARLYDIALDNDDPKYVSPGQIIALSKIWVDPNEEQTFLPRTFQEGVLLYFRDQVLPSISSLLESESFETIEKYRNS